MFVLFLTVGVLKQEALRLCKVDFWDAIFKNVVYKKRTYHYARKDMIS